MSVVDAVLGYESKQTTGIPLTLLMAFSYVSRVRGVDSTSEENTRLIPPGPVEHSGCV